MLFKRPFFFVRSPYDDTKKSMMTTTTIDECGGVDDGDGDDFVSRVQGIVGCSIIDESWYRAAFTHPSAVEDPLLSYERLEFLGDASLSMTVASYLFERFPQNDEGFLTKVRSRIVSTENMAHLARCLDLGAIVRLGPTAKPSLRTNCKVLEDVLEALVGAVYKDLGQLYAKKFFLRLLDNFCDFRAFLVDKNYKDGAMRLTQALGHPLPRYACVPAPENVPGRFCATVHLCGASGFGSGISKRDAEQAAAKDALAKLGYVGANGEPHVPSKRPPPTTSLSSSSSSS